VYVHHNARIDARDIYTRNEVCFVTLLRSTHSFVAVFIMDRFHCRSAHA